MDEQFQITHVKRAWNDDYTLELGMRYRLESDPDIESSYTEITTSLQMGDQTFPFFDIDSMPPGTYVVHLYSKTGGFETGVKYTYTIGSSTPTPAP